MQSIQDVMPKIKSNDAVNQLLQQVVSQPLIRKFIEANPGISKEQVTLALPVLLDYLKYHGVFLNGDTDTSHLVPGMSARLTFDGMVEIELFPSEAYRQEMIVKKYIEHMHVPENLLKAEFKDWTTEQVKNTPAVLQTSILLNNIHEAKGHTGLYIYGTYGVGKTHLLGAIAHNLFEKRIPSMIVFWPELIREIKQDFSQAGSIVDRLKYVDVLMIDDIGAEMQSSFSRDEILLPILNHRMNHKKLTFFTSNLSMDELRTHFTYTQRGDKEPLKAERIMERIRSLATPVQFTGENQRNK